MSDDFNFDDTSAGPGHGNDTIFNDLVPFSLGRDFNLASRDQLVFDTHNGNAGDASGWFIDIGDWDGEGDGDDLMIFTNTGSVMVADMFDGVDPLSLAFANFADGDGTTWSVTDLNAYSQGNATYNMITFV